MLMIFGHLSVILGTSIFPVLEVRIQIFMSSLSISDGNGHFNTDTTHLVLPFIKYFAYRSMGCRRVKL